MNETIKNNKAETLNVISNYRESILEEFLLIAEHLNKDLTLLIETGIDKERFICLQGVEVGNPFYYTFLNKMMVEEFQQSLLKITKNKKSAIQRFHNLTTGRYSKLYSEYVDIHELITLANAYLEALKAENLIKSIL